MNAWDVYHNENLIDIVFFDDDCDEWYVKKALIEHDGYPLDILVEVECRSY